MEYSFPPKQRSPCHRRRHHRHHHHHHHHHPLCPHHHHHHHHNLCYLHHHHHCNYHSDVCHRHGPISSYLLQKDLNFQANNYHLHKETSASHNNNNTQVLEEPELNELEFEEDVDEEDPVFVLTDEWKDFFAKSEAKRKSEKQQTKKKTNTQ